MPAEKEDKQKEEEELRGEWMADTGVMEMYRDLSGLARIILNFFQIRHEHEQKLLFLSSLACLCRRWAAQKRPLFSLLRCGEHDVTCFVQPLHQNFLFCNRAAKILCIEHTDVHRLDTATLMDFTPKQLTLESLNNTLEKCSVLLQLQYDSSHKRSSDLKLSLQPFIVLRNNLLGLFHG